MNSRQSREVVRDAFKDSLKRVGQVAFGMVVGVCGYHLMMGAGERVGVASGLQVGARMLVYQDQTSCAANHLGDCDRTVFVGASAKWSASGECVVTVSYLGGADDPKGESRGAIWAPMVMNQSIADPCPKDRECACGVRKT